VPQGLPGVSEEQALEAFRDPCWRLERLFSIRTRDGSVVKFTPRPQQRTIIEKIYRQDCRRIIILKARQIGFSTLLGVICADRLCFGLGQQISLIDQTIEDARQKLRDIVLVAYDSLDPALKKELPIVRSNTGELAVKFVRHEEAEDQRDVRRHARTRGSEQLPLDQRMGRCPVERPGPKRGDPYRCAT
jgi:hypothetical protein